MEVLLDILGMQDQSISLLTLCRLRVDLVHSRIRRYLKSDRELYEAVWTLTGSWLVCHCAAKQDCHAEGLIIEHTPSFPTPSDRDLFGGA